MFSVARRAIESPFPFALVKFIIGVLVLCFKYSLDILNIATTSIVLPGLAVVTLLLNSNLYIE